MFSINNNRNHSLSFGSLQISQNKMTQKALKKCSDYTLETINQSYGTLQDTKYIDAYIESDKKGEMNLRIKTKEGFNFPNKSLNLTYPYSSKEPYNYAIYPNGEYKIGFYRQHNIPPLGGHQYRPQKAMELEKTGELDGSVVYKIDPRTGVTIYEHIAGCTPCKEATIYSKKGPTIDSAKFNEYIRTIKEFDDTIGKIIATA